MGLVGHFVRLDSATVDNCRADQNLIFSDAYSPPGLERINIDRTWDALAYLLSKPYRDWMNGEDVDSSSPPDLMLAATKGAGGQNLGDIYFLLNPEAVREISKTLESIDLKDLKLNFDPENMDDADVYPAIWVRDGDDSLQDYIYPHFLNLKNFYLKAAMANQHVIAYRV